jgi:hypothetical protein
MNNNKECGGPKCFVTDERIKSMREGVTSIGHVAHIICGASDISTEIVQ